DAFFDAACEWLRAIGGEVRVVGDAVAPVLRGVISGVAVDLGYAERPAGLAPCAPEALTAAELGRFDRASQGALGAVRDASCVRALVAARGADEAFGVAVRALKRWARARGLYSNAFGFLGGFGWALLCAWGCTRGEDGAPSAPAVLERALAAL